MLWRILCRSLSLVVREQRKPRFGSIFCRPIRMIWKDRVSSLSDQWKTVQCLTRQTTNSLRGLPRKKGVGWNLWTTQLQLWTTGIKSQLSWALFCCFCFRFKCHRNLQKTVRNYRRLQYPAGDHWLISRSCFQCTKMWNETEDADWKRHRVFCAFEAE